MSNVNSGCFFFEGRHWGLGTVVSYCFLAAGQWKLWIITLCAHARLVLQRSPYFLYPKKALLLSPKPLERPTSNTVCCLGNWGFLS